MYNLIYSPRAQRDIKKLDRVVRRRLKKALERIREDPLRFAGKLENQKLGGYRFRIGNYRIIFDLDRENIVILRIGHRREIYR